jgi:class 3 adenylate cyclase/tetratricopeptide (TPR) repeat protein
MAEGPARDRRQLTVLFFDVVDASALSERLDPEDLRDVIQALHATCAKEVLEHDGHVAQRLGDGLLAYFGYPQAFEDSPHRAVRAGLAALREVRRQAKDLVPRIGSLVQMRIGIDTGPVVLENVGTSERPEILAIGEAPNKAARVQAAAAADSLVVSETTQRLTRGYFSFVDLGSKDLKGFSDPVRLHAVVDETALRSRLDAPAEGELTRFVNRRVPLGFLLDRWESAREGAAPVVLLSGDAGIGKSRLMRRFREQLEPRSALFITCYCSSFFQRTALWPVVDMLDRRLSVDSGAGREAKLERLRGELDSLGLATPEAVSSMASLLSLPVPDLPARVGMTPQRERQETFEVLFTWLMRLTRTQPVLLLVEDLHWVDPSTLEFLALVTSRAPTGPLMVVLTHRPEFTCPLKGPRIGELALGRLDREYAEQMLSAVAGEVALSGDVVGKLLSRADGVPLYLEEITKAVVEDSLRAPAKVGAARDLAIPATLQDSLAARLDRLGTGKAVAQLAATLGRTFDFALLRAVSDLPENVLRTEVDRLVAAELLYRRGTSSQETFIFKHALIQDAAYESLLRKVRQEYHLRIVNALAAPGFSETAQSQPELMAHHYAGAGMPREAIANWMIAGQRAMARSAFTEAASIFSRALRELPALPSASERDKTEIELRSGLGLAMISTQGWAVPEVEENYTRARLLCESFGNVPVQVLYGISAVHVVRGDRAGSLSLAAMIRDLAAHTDDPGTKLVARSVLGAVAFWEGQYQKASVEFREAREIKHALRDAAANGDPGIQDYGLDAWLYAELYLSLCLQNMGALAEAESSWRANLSWIEATRHPYMIATVLAYGATVTQVADDVEQTAAIATRLAHLSVENGFHYWHAIARCASGWAAARTSGGENGIPEIEQGLATLRFLGAYIVFPHFATFLIDAYLVRGDLEKAAQATEDALSVMEGRLCRNHEPRLLCLKGRVQARGGDRAAAVATFERAIELAEAQGDTLLASDALLHLGQLADDREQARALAVRLSKVVARAADGGTHPRFAAAREWLSQQL